MLSCVGICDIVGPYSELEAFYSSTSPSTNPNYIQAFIPIPERTINLKFAKTLLSRKPSYYCVLRKNPVLQFKTQLFGITCFFCGFGVYR